MKKPRAILLVGESDVGKTHFGAQLLKRLIRGDGQLKMAGAATNLAPFEPAMKQLDEGMTADHTPRSTYSDSLWPIVDEDGRTAELVWPDYGGEQVKDIIANRRVPASWRARIADTPAWALLIRLNKMRVTDDIFSRPLADLKGASRQNEAIQISDQARLVELLQILLHARGGTDVEKLETPRLAILLSCWDEMSVEGRPMDILRERLPMFADFITSRWRSPIILGLSALSRPLASDRPDAEYAALGPEQFGFVINQGGEQTTDLTLPIKLLLADPA